MNVSEDTSDRLISGVQNGLLDAAVIALPYDIGNLQSVEFAQENFYVIAHVNNPLAQESKVNSRKLKNSHLMLLGEGHCLRDHIIDVCKIHDEVSREQFKEASLNTLIQLTANDMGVTLVPEMALPQMRALPALKTIELDAPGPHRRLAVITRPHYPRGSDLEIIMALFAQAQSQLQAQAKA